MRAGGASVLGRAALPLGLAAALATPGTTASAQHSYTVGPPNPYLEAHPMGPPRYDTDRDRSCVGGYNSETPYAADTCMPVGTRQFTMTFRVSRPAPARAAPIARAVDLPAAIADCWAPAPPPDGQRWRITTRLSFSAAGRAIGRPRVTWFAGGDRAARDRLTKSLLEALARCAPFRFTPALGRSIAGRPIAIRFILQPALPASGRGDGHDHN